MAKFIEDIHNLYNLLAGKNIATKQPPERVDQVFWEITIGIFNDHYDHYVKTQKISDYLLPFKRKAEISLTNGVAPLPPDYEHVRLVETEAGENVPVIEDKFWPGRARRKLDPPTATKPICRIENSIAETPVRQIQLVPSTVPKVFLYYFKTPAKAVYAYEKVGNRYVYNEAGSVDSEFSPLLFPQIAMKLLSRFGINLREQQLIQYAETMKAQEDRK